MSSNILQKPSSLDAKSHKLRAFFRVGSLLVGEGGWISDPNWWVQSCERLAGQDGSAVINIPTRLNSNDENAYSVVSPDGPMKHIKIGTRVLIKREWLNESGKAVTQGCWAGKVLSIAPDLGSDTMAVHCICARHELRNLRVIGRHIWNPETNAGSYQQGWAAHFNPGGRPNCIFDAYGRPRFAPHPDYGLGSDEPPPDASEAHTSKACYWPLASICAYIAEHYGPDAEVQTDFPWLPRAPGWLVWPVSFAAAIDREYQDNFNDGSGQGGQNTGRARTGREVNLEGVSILDALDMLLEMAGGYTFDLVPQFDAAGTGDFKAQLVAVPMQYTDDKNAISLPMGEFGIPLADKAVITGGQVELNGVNYLSRLAGASALVLIERLMSSPAQLEWSHDAARFKLWRKAIIDLGNDEQAFQEACQQYEDVAQFIRIVKDYDFQLGTDQAGMPRADINRQPWPALLSMMPAGGQDFAGLRYPIWIEVKVGSTWTLATRFNGLESHDNGNIMVPQLRDLSAEVNSWYPVSGNAYPPFNVAADGGADIAMREIRMTLAIPADHRLQVAFKLAADLISGPTAPESIGASPDADMIDPEHVRAGFMDLGDLYALWLRFDSWPEPRSISGVVSALDAETAEKSRFFFRNDTASAEAAVRRELKRAARLAKTGALEFKGWLVGAYAPGMQVKALAPVGGGAPFPLRAVIRGVRWVCGEGETYTEVLFG